MKTKIGKKVLPVFLSLLLLIGLAPTTVFAAGDMYIYIGDIDIVNSTTHSVPCGDGTITYDTASKVLTLENATLTSEDTSKAVIRGSSEVSGVNPEVKIVVKGENTITAPMAIDFKGANLSFSGSGKLVINGGSVGIRSRVYNTGSGRISFSDGVNVTVKLTGGDPDTSKAYWGWPAICANGDALSINNATIYVENKGGRGIAGSGVSILNGSEVTSIVDTTEAGHDYNAFLISNGGLNVQNSTLTAKVLNGPDMGLVLGGTGDVTFKDSIVTVSAAGGGYGICLSQFAGAFTINGGTVNGSGTAGIGHFGAGAFSIYGGAQVTAAATNSHGLYSHQATATMSISGEGTKVKATSDAGLGVYSIGSVALSDGAYVEASGKSYNFYSKGAISISDSTLDAGHASSYTSVWAVDTLSITGDSDVTAMGIGSTKGFTVEPAAGQLVGIKTGSSESDAKHIDGSPFDVKTTLSNYQSGTFFYSSLHTHNLSHVVASKPTCTKDGNIEHWYCPGCDSYFSDADCKTEISKADAVDKATGHSWNTSEWSGNGTHHWHACQNDSCPITDNSQKDGYAEHRFEWKIDKPAEVGAAGQKHEECACGYAKEPVEIPALPAPEYPPVIDNPAGGKITVNPENPKAGETVTVTVEPEDGKTVDIIVVTDENGKQISVVDNGDGIYTFIQPDGEVTIKAVYKTETNRPSTGDHTPQTGENGNLVLLFALMSVGAAGLGGSIYLQKRRNRVEK